MNYNEYETVIIVRPDIDDAKTYAIIENLENIIAENDGHLLDSDDWGKRKLAYPIKKHIKGHYVVQSYLAPATLVKEYERRIRIQDDVLRFLTVKVADFVDADTRVAQAAEVRQKRDEEKARAAEAAAAEDAAQETV